MIPVIQVFKKIGHFEKPDYIPAVRKSFWDWPDSVSLANGQIIDKQLWLPQTEMTRNWNTAHQIIIINSFRTDISSYTPTSPTSKQQFEIFRIVKNTGDSIDIFTHFSEHRFSEVPMSNNHQIDRLKPGEALRYLFNDRADFSMTGRRQRSFLLYDYIIHYAGLVKTIAFKPRSEFVEEADLPKDYKLVDERRWLN